LRADRTRATRDGVERVMDRPGRFRVTTLVIHLKIWMIRKKKAQDLNHPSFEITLSKLRTQWSFEIRHVESLLRTGVTETSSDMVVLVSLNYGFTRELADSTNFGKFVETSRTNKIDNADMSSINSVGAVFLSCFPSAQQTAFNCFKF
jgi:hypothetical protein